MLWLKIAVNCIFIWLAAVGISFLGPRGGLQDTPLNFLSNLCTDTLWVSLLLTFGTFALAHLIYRLADKTILPKVILILGQIAHPAELPLNWLWVSWLTPWVILSFIIISPTARYLACPTPDLDPIFKIQQKPGTLHTALPDQELEVPSAQTIVISLASKQGASSKTDMTCHWSASQGAFWNPNECAVFYDTPMNGSAILNIEIKQNEKIKNFGLTLRVR